MKMIKLVNLEARGSKRRQSIILCTLRIMIPYLNRKKINEKVIINISHNKIRRLKKDFKITSSRLEGY